MNVFFQLPLYDGIIRTETIKSIHYGEIGDGSPDGFDEGDTHYIHFITPTELCKSYSYGYKSRILMLDDLNYIKAQLGIKL